jgi:hypothetical protein
MDPHDAADTEDGTTDNDRYIQQFNVFYKLYIMWWHIIYSVAFLL